VEVLVESQMEDSMITNFSTDVENTTDGFVGADGNPWFPRTWGWTSTTTSVSFQTG